MLEHIFLREINSVLGKLLFYDIHLEITVSLDWDKQKQRKCSEGDEGWII